MMKRNHRLHRFPCKECRRNRQRTRDIKEIPAIAATDNNADMKERKVENAVSDEPQKEDQDRSGE